MVPRAPMRVTKNRAGAMLVSLLAVAVFLVACGPPGPRALLEGKDLLESGKATEAIEELKTATTLMPTNAAAWNYLGVAYHRAGSWTNAVEAYSRALRFNRELLEVRFNLGCLWLEQNKLDDAKAEFTAYTLRRPNAGDGWVKLGTTQLRARDVAAEKSFREALRVNARDVEALNGLGMVFAQRNRPRDAADSFTAALQQQPDYRPALLNLATVLQQQLNAPAEALKRYREYLALQPRDEDWAAVNAIVRALEPPTPAPVRSAPTNPVVAAPVRTNPVVAAPTPTNATRPLAATPPRALAEIKPVATNTPRPAPATPASVVRVASNTTAAPPAPEVVRLAPEPVIKITPDDKPVASRATTTGSTQAAAPVSSSVGPKAATEVTPERKGFLSKLNPFKRDPKAVVPSVTVTSAPPVNPGSERYVYLSPTAPASGDRKSAEQALGQGQQAQRAGRLMEAMQYYRRATLLDGSYFEAHYSLGLAAFTARSFKTAAEAWETAIAVRPDSRDARYNFALTLKAAGHPQAAADELEKLLALHPDEARGHLTLGNLYAEQLGDKSRARRHYHQVLQLDPRNPQASAIRYWLVANPG